MQNISFLNVVNLLLDAVCMVRPDSTIVFVSPAFERIFGYAPQEVIGRRMLDMVHPDDLEATRNEAQSVMDGVLQLRFENRYVRKDGRIVHIRWSARWLPDEQVRLAVAHDITESKVHQSRQAAIYAISEAAHAAQTLDSLFKSIHGIIGRLLVATNFSVLLRDADTQELRCAYHANEHSAAPDTVLCESDERCAQVLSGKTVLLTPQDATMQSVCSASLMPGQPAPLYWLGTPLHSQKGVMGALVLQSYAEHEPFTEQDKELLQFVSGQVAVAIERRQMHEKLAYLAQFDALTGLPNRMVLLDRLQIALARASRDDALVSLLFVDLDDFKRVNDTLGHAMGDLLLQRVAARLQGCVRASDTVARLGGDEFVVLLESGRQKDHVHTVAHKIQAAFAHPFDLDGTELHMHASVGTALYPDDGRDAATLLEQADRSMYLRKQAGGGGAAAAAPATPTP